MHNSLLFAESLLIWAVANYAFGSDPTKGGKKDSPTKSAANWRWWKTLLRSLGSAILLGCIGLFCRAYLEASALLMLGSFAILAYRRQFVPLQYLLEFELVANAVVVYLFWQISEHACCNEAPFPGIHLSHSQTSCLFIATALMLYTVRGGDYLVASLLKKTDSQTEAAQSALPAADSYGPMIGYLERIIVVMIVVAGSFEALAFFFAAKGLVRSKELENHQFSNYFLLGSLASFLVALSAGLILQQTVHLLWK
ncbi:MAG TPA: hypothetical protein VGG45_15200 [Terracidiphilus sp.]|jgi:hypothetical protein